MNESNYFAVTLPESSKVVTIVARKNTDSIEILHHAVSRTEYFMGGKIENALPDAVQAIRHTLPSCDSNLVVEATYLGISGALSVQVNAENTITIPPHREITQKDKDLIDESAVPALNNQLPIGYQLLDYVPLHYYVGPEEKLNPLGHRGDSLTVSAVGVAGHSRGINALVDCLSRASLETAETIPTATAAVHSTVASRDEKHQAVALIDIGHSVTSVAVCVNGKIISSRSFQSGGANVTQDIREILQAKDPESVKIKYGSCVPSFVEDASEIAIKKTNGETHLEKRSYLSRIIQKRIEFDIIQPALKYIDREIIPLTKLSGGIVLVGGTSGLDHIEDLTKLIAADLGCPHILVQKPLKLSPEHIDNLPDEISGPEFAAALGLLSVAANWSAHETPESLPEIRTIGSSIVRAVAGVFGA